MCGKYAERRGGGETIDPLLYYDKGIGLIRKGRAFVRWACLVFPSRPEDNRRLVLESRQGSTFRYEAQGNFSLRYRRSGSPCGGR